MSKMPQTYLPPLGGPLYWMNEQSGELSAAVMGYLGHVAGQTPEPEQLALLVDYLHYYVNAPCWDISANAFREVDRANLDGAGQAQVDTAAILDGLRKRAPVLSSYEEVSKFLSDCLEIGLDPL